LGEADTVIGNGQDGLGTVFLQGNGDFPFPPLGKGMSQGIGQQLIDEQPQGDGRIIVGLSLPFIDLRLSETHSREILF